MPPPPHHTLSRRSGYDHVVIPFPVPPSIKCGLCPLARGGGPWKTEERQALARKHLKEKHDGLALKFKCVRCGDEFASLHGGRRHNPCRRSIAPSPITTAPTNSPANSRLSARAGANPNMTPLIGPSASPCSRSDITFAPSFVNGDKLIMMYPGRPSQCPVAQCADEFTSFDTLSGAMNSMHRHLHEAHGLKAVKFWRCSICGVEDTGLRMNVHYKRCSRTRASNSPASTTERTVLSNSHDSMAPAGSASVPRHSPSSRTSLIATPTTTTPLTAPSAVRVHSTRATNVPSLTSVVPLYEVRTATTVVEIDVTASTPPEEIITPSLGGSEVQTEPTPPAAMSINADASRTATSGNDEWIEVIRRFRVLWSQAITNCSSLTDLEETLIQCSSEWRQSG